MKRTLIDQSVSDRVLTVGECYWAPVYGGIVSVIKSYRDCFETFPFIASSGQPTWKDKLRYDLGGLFALGWRLLWDQKIRIVHIHTAAGGSFDKHAYYAWLARLMGRKVVMHSHASRFKVWYEGLPERHQRRVRKVLARLDRLIVLSASWRDFFVSIGVSPEKVRILNNITDPADREKVARTPGGPVRLLFLGEIGPRKGVFDLLKAMALLEGTAPGKAWLEIGGNKNEEALKEAIRAQYLEDCVHFNGFVSGELKKELLSRTDVFVLPSYNEGLPISILEAMSYGCAIISTPVGGIPEVVKDNGVLVQPGDIEGIAAAIARCGDEDACRKMGLSSLKMVEAFHPEAVMASLKQIYESLLR